MGIIFSRKYKNDYTIEEYRLIGSYYRKTKYPGKPVYEDLNVIVKNIEYEITNNGLRWRIILQKQWKYENLVWFYNYDINNKWNSEFYISNGYKQNPKSDCQFKPLCIFKYWYEDSNFNTKPDVFYAKIINQNNKVIAQGNLISFWNKYKKN